MENAADALKISFAVFVFVIAILVTFTMISHAKQTSDIVLYHSDKTSFYEYETSKETNREVDISTVISTLYKSTEETMTVSIVIDEDTKYEFSSAKTEEEINEFIYNNIEETLKQDTYVEEFIEVPYDGIYKTGEDGSQMTIAEGVKKVYITYYQKAYYKRIHPEYDS